MDKQKERGFTVVEVLLAIVISAVMIPARAVGLNTLVALNNRARDLTLISIIAENKIESLRSIGYNSVAVGSSTFTTDLPQTIGSPKTATATVTQNTGYKTIDINITYQDFGRQRTILYKSVISETGVGQ